MNDIPDGFEPVSRVSAFTRLIGPIYQKRNADTLVIALRAQPKHCNTRNTVHGGVLDSLADIAMGYSIAFSTDPPTPIITVSQSMDFAGKADKGDWIEAHTDIQKIGRRMAFANCYFWVADRRIARSSAVFALPADA